MIEQELPEEKRADAVSSMVYEASVRIRDPVYGCAGAICRLQKQVSDLKAQLARGHAELTGARAHHSHLLALLCVEVATGRHIESPAYCAAMDYSSQLVAPTAQAATRCTRKAEQSNKGKGEISKTRSIAVSME
ncbi:LOB domain-containing protein 1-like [Phragmites australis]|uniref:LOB domain-containing protein 1-like n=1 Tax=Phragmites australis TaxID=29695 RepID=UPI002D7808FB|nr:LOB domain-containing protein 1-like [Phragmites australis]